MNLSIIGSSSKGNCYLLHNDSEALVIEAGVKFSLVKQALNFDISKIVGVLVSHSHADHAGYLNEYLRAGMEVFTTKDALQIFSNGCFNSFSPVKSGTAHRAGNFRFQAFNVVHDVECFGFLIDHPETGKFCFITDTHYSPFTFKGLNNIIIEANYSEAIINSNLNSGSINYAYYERVLRSHMSLETTLAFLKANDLTQVNNIVLTHLSDGNSDARAFKALVEQETGIPTTIADCGVSIEFNKTSF